MIRDVKRNAEGQRTETEIGRGNEEEEKKTADVKERG